jgi:hypothetical protein
MSMLVVNERRSYLRTFWILTIFPLRLQRYALGHNSQLKMLVIIATNCKNFRHGSEAFNDCADFLKGREEAMQLYIKKGQWANRAGRVRVSWRR